MFLINKNSVVDISTNDSYCFHTEQVQAEYVRNNGPAEISIIEYVRDKYVIEDKAVIDIGAHCGFYTFELGKKAQHVHAFECSKKTFCYLCANVALHNLENKTSVYNIALSNVSGTCTFYNRTEDGGSDGIMDLPLTNYRDKYTVEQQTLDYYNLTNIGFIKIDVEGNEEKVIQGAITTIKNNNFPPLLFESWDKPEIYYINMRTRLFRIIKMLGYTITPIFGRTDMFIAEKVII